MLKNRKKLLYFAAAVVGIAFCGDQAYSRFYEQPMAAIQRNRTALRKKIGRRNREFAETKSKLSHLANLQQRSLPADLELARSKYQAWLLKLIEHAQWQTPNIDSSDPVSHRGLYHRLTFMVRGRGSLAQVTQFLHEFYEVGHLHQIRSLTLSPVASVEKLDVAMTIDALVLAGAANEQELSAITSSGLISSPLNDYQIIAQRNLFLAGSGALLAKGIVLSAMTSDAVGNEQAWFSVKPSSATRVVGIGESFRIESLTVRLVELRDQQAVVEIDGTIKTLSVGQSLAEAAPAQPAA